MSPIQEQGTYMFLSTITYFCPHVYFRDKKNLFEKREIMHEKRKFRGKGRALPEERQWQGEGALQKGGAGAPCFFRKGESAAPAVGRSDEAFL